MKRISLIIYCLLISLAALSITPTWGIDFGSVFDNREGDANNTAAKTYFFTTLSAEAGLKFTATDRIAGGAVWTQPLMNGVDEGRVVPTLYYRHSGEKWKFSMGLFPRTQMREPLPGFLWCDSLAYFQKNIRGALVEYASRSGFMEAYIDWRAHQGEKRREAFNIMFHGEWQPGKSILLVGGHALMNHFAKTKHPDQSQHVVDNFLVNPYIGVDLSRKTRLDSLRVRFGGLMTIERNRADHEWKTPGGLWMDATFEWRWLGARTSMYAGGKLFPLYGEFGELLYQGEPYYRSSLYSRTDIYAHVYRNKFIDLEAQLNFNVAKNDFMFYQRLILNISLGK